MRDNRDILEKLRWLANDMEDMEAPGEWLLPVSEAHSIIVRLRGQIDKLEAMVTPKPLDDNAPKDRVLIGVERPPYEDKNYYSRIQWREDTQRWMVECGFDWSVRPAKQLWAYSGASHYLDPLELPGLPYWEGDDEDGDDVEQ